VEINFIALFVFTEGNVAVVVKLLVQTPLLQSLLNAEPEYLMDEHVSSTGESENINDDHQNTLDKAKNRNETGSNLILA